MPSQPTVRKQISSLRSHTSCVLLFTVFLLAQKLFKKHRQAQYKVSKSPIFPFGLGIEDWEIFQSFGRFPYDLDVPPTKRLTNSRVKDDMIRTIVQCSELLVDTMDQILDFTKTSRTDLPSSKVMKATPPADIISGLELSSLVEKVVAGVSAGHRYRKSGYRTLKEHGAIANQGADLGIENDDLRIILSIQRHASCILKSQATSWKMILTNLVGNALKYTPSGCVHVSLLSNETHPLSVSPSGPTVTLRIEDTGKGISKSYLKHELFTPFVQEDPHAVGTGLGLSIVRQLVTDLGGKIDVESEVGYGTTIRVVVPTKAFPSVIHPSGPEEDLISSIRERCSGMKLCMVGFEYYPDIAETPSGILDRQARCMLALKSSFGEMAKDWFGLEVITASSVSSTEGDLVLVSEAKWHELGAPLPDIPLMVLEDTSAKIRIHNKDGLFSLTQPVGPNKLARTLALCLDYKASSTRHQIEKLPELSVALPSAIPCSPEDGRNATSPKNASCIEPNGFGEANSAEDKIPVTSQMVLNLKNVSPGAFTTPSRSKVLLVEDNIINMKILVNHMKRASQDYVCAANGLEAFEKFKEDLRSFKVIFMDLSMPIMDGLTSTRHIRAHESEFSLPRTRIVALTCFSSADYQRDAAISGVDHFFVKPVPMKALRPILELNPDTFDKID